MTDKTEEQWKADSDARSLVEAEAIKADGPRYKKAQEAAKRMLEEEKARAEAMEKIANSKLEYKNTPREDGK